MSLSVNPALSLKAVLMSLNFLLVVFFNSYAQVALNSPLFTELAKKDSLLFDEGFNKCNAGAFEDLIPEDFEFYHDISGLQERAGFFRAYKANICSNSDRKPLRELVPGSLQVFRLENNGDIYGAIQQGEHRFYMKEPGQEPYLTGIAKFTHLWMLEEGQWRLKRVLSYDHKAG